MVDLKGKPFYLSDEDIRWISETMKWMSVEEKIGQLFVPICYSSDPEFLEKHLLRYYIGGIMYRSGEGEIRQENHRWLQEHSNIPLLIGANLEYGGNGIASEGTYFATQMEVAATGDLENARLLGEISAKEGMACGCNWAFAPVVDIDRNWRNPITNVRTYGNDPEFVRKCGLAYQKAVQNQGMATTIKHFPGDGCDEVDQHILTSVNHLSCEEWDETYGKIYQSLIEENALSVMVGHIAMPAYQNYYNPKSPKQLIPASLSPELLKKLLRGKLGFNGLVITDSTCMVGFCSAMSRAKALPYCIESGCDMILFNKVLDEDYHFMLDGYKNGILSSKRLDEAVLRILATKAAIGLHNKDKESYVPKKDALKILGCEEHKEVARKCADEAITLVKDTQNLLPLNPQKTKRILLEIMGDFPSNERIILYTKKKLEKEGFEILVYEKETPGSHDFSVKTFCEKCDLVLYLGNVENSSNKVTNRLNWHTFFGNGDNCPWFVKEKPVLFVSLANPYHLIDIPMIQTYINCYANSNIVLDMLLEKLMGKSSWKGKSPIDPFCGKDYLKY